MTKFSEIEIRCKEDLLEALLARKNELGLSHELVEDLGGLTRGHFDKIFGPSRGKNPGWFVFETLNGVLAVKWRCEIDEKQAQLMQPRWERRNAKQIRLRKHLVNRADFEQAKSEMFAEMARRRALMLPASIRSKIASNAARVRWRKQRRVKRGSVS